MAELAVIPPRSRRSDSRPNDPSAADFSRDGFAVLERFFEPGELEPLRVHVDALLAAPLPPGCERPHNTLAPLDWGSEVVRHALCSESRMARLGAAVGARDLRWISGYVSVKDARSAPLWWHQDWWCWDHQISFRPCAAQVAVLCYLTETEIRNGALRVLPGSHRVSTPIHGFLPEPHGAEANELPFDHPAMADCPGQITLAAKAGDAVVLDYRLLHGTHPNETAQRRDCILLSFIPAWRTLPREIKAHLIAHPALPDHTEAAARSSSGYDALLPLCSGAPATLPVNRVPPPRFGISDFAAIERDS